MSRVLVADQKETVQTESTPNEFGLYLDDCGNSTTTPKDPQPFFSVGGVLVNRREEEEIKQRVDQFRASWNIPLTEPLHGTEIRSKKNAFKFIGLLDQDELNRFHAELFALVTESRLCIHACVINRQGYYERFHPEHGNALWPMRKSAAAIVIERAAKHVHQQNGKLKVFYEQSGKKEHALMEETYERLRERGHPFDTQNAQKYNPLDAELLNVLLGGIERKTKNNQIMQLADLCLHPVTVVKNGKLNRWHQGLTEQKLLIDSLVPEADLPELGIKYYCFPQTVIPPE